MLPDADGLDLCRRLRASTDVPILMLTARGEPMDRVVGLEVGADDYLAKPFEPRELQARLRAILRRKGAPAKSETLRFGRLEIDKGARVVRVDGEERAITSYQFALLLIAGRARRPRAVARRADGPAEGREARSLRPLGRRPYLAASAPPSRTIPRSRAAS